MKCQNPDKELVIARPSQMAVAISNVRLRNPDGHRERLLRFARNDILTLFVITEAVGCATRCTRGFARIAVSAGVNRVGKNDICPPYNLGQFE
ncbi:MAG: hypothetical protein A2Z25_19300 [Planctomycetes bacterium RBG_16_55_9]|nr:MAG: hypothetical protein A2Z25_19300 [Planctomycetes bacterium RBG_16_55_9]